MAEDEYKSKLLKILRLAHRNENAEEARAALRRAAHVATQANAPLKDAITGLLDLPAHHVDRVIEALIGVLEGTLGFAPAVPRAPGQDAWTDPTPRPTGDTGSQQVWAPGAWAQMAPGRWQGPRGAWITRQPGGQFVVSGPGAFGQTTNLTPWFWTLREAMFEADAWTLRVAAWPNTLRRTVSYYS